MRNDTIATARFVIDGERLSLSLHRDGDRFSVTGEALGHLGQCEMTFRALDTEVADVTTILDLWDLWHLKKAPESAFETVTEALQRLDGTRHGHAPDIDDAPELDDDVIDSRDVIKRLEIYREAVAFMGFDDDALDTMTMEKMPESPEITDEDDLGTIEEFIALRDFEKEASNYAEDWSFGTSMIADHYMRDYAEEQAESIGAIDPNATWPLNFIDWDRATDAFKQDYTEVEFKGTSYWIR
jgi:hypothetical protein